jgi:hypothetical protein
MEGKKSYREKKDDRPSLLISLDTQEQRPDQD